MRYARHDAIARMHERHITKQGRFESALDGAPVDGGYLYA
jgi:hypothetical protein